MSALLIEEHVHDDHAESRAVEKFSFTTRRVVVRNTDYKARARAILDRYPKIFARLAE